MSARRPPRDADELLRDGGGEIGDLYRRLPRYEPPRRLDRAVLGEAARAVHSGKAPRRQRWVLGIGSAAGVVLAAGIAWRIGHDAMTPSETGSAMSPPRVVPVQPITEPARARHEEAAPAQPETAARADAANATKAAKPSAAGSTRETFADRAKASNRRADAPVAAAAQKQPTPPPVPAPAAAAPPAAFPNAAQRPEPTDRIAAPASSGAVSTQDEEKDLRRAPAAARAVSPMTSPSSSVELQRDMQLAPQDWLSHIRQLRRQGRLQQARESLSLFERTHPDWVVPDELRDLRD